MLVPINLDFMCVFEFVLMNTRTRIVSKGIEQHSVETIFIFAYNIYC